MDAIDKFLSKSEVPVQSGRPLSELFIILRDIESDLSKVVDLITFDPALTARVLMASNSVYFATSEPVNDVAAAINRLGYQNVYRIVVTVKGADLFQGFNPAHGVDSSKLWKHAVCAAFSAQFIAEDFGADTGMYFTAGLLHDLGKTILAQVFKDAYGAAVVQAHKAAKPLVEAERTAFGADHADVGARMLKRWRLSDDLVGGVRFHHDFRAAGSRQRPAAIIHLADALAHTVENAETGQAPQDTKPTEALAILGLSPESLSHYLGRIQENIEFVEGMFRLSQ